MSTDAPVFDSPVVTEKSAPLTNQRSALPGKDGNRPPIDLLAIARDVFETEAQAVLALAERLGEEFTAACNLIYHSRGRVVVCGVGKSGHISNKIAATLASTGTAAFFVHPTEAAHGDFGMIKPEDVVIALSYSGESDELKTLLPLLKRLGVSTIALTGNKNSALARGATVHLDIAVANEACPLGLAPTSSTTAALAMGDALAVAVLQQRGFTADDFARTHPAGKLGKRLLLRVVDVAVSDNAVPMVTQQASLKDALYTMSAGQLGFLIIVDETQKLAGVFSDGDLRRALDRNIDINTALITDVMTSGGQSIEESALAADALFIMEKHRIYALPVVRADGTVCGALNMHSLLKAGVV